MGQPKTTSDDVAKLNAKIEILADQFNIPYLNVFSSLVDYSGRLDKKYTEDGLHINGEGYSVWKTLIEHYVNN